MPYEVCSTLWNSLVYTFWGTCPSSDKRLS